MFFSRKSSKIEKVCLDCAGVYGSHIGPPKKRRFWVDFASFWAVFSVFGTDPEEHCEDSEKWDQISKKTHNMCLFPDPFWSNF